MNAKILLTSVNFQLREEMRAQITAAVQRLFHQELTVTTARVNVEGDYSRRCNIRYRVSIVLQLRSSEVIVAEEADQLTGAVLLAVSAAERQVQERFYLRQREGMTKAS